MSAEFIRVDASNGDALDWTTNLPSRTAFTAMCLCKFSAFVGDTPNIFALGATGGVGVSLYSDEANWILFDGSGNVTGPAVSTGVWYWAVLRGNGTEIKAYVKAEGGGSFTTLTSTQPAYTPDRFCVARWINANSYWTGSGIGVKQWDAVLSDAEIDAETAQRAPVRSTNLSRYVPLNTSTDTADTSGNGRNPTIIGTLSTDADNPATAEFSGGIGITATSSATPANGSDLTITGSGFGASQGAGGVTIGGVSQPVVSWSNTSIVVTVDVGTNKFGISLDVVATDNALTDSSPFALTSVQSTAGGGFVDIGTPDTTSANRLTASGDLASGDQVEWSDAAAVTVDVDGTWSSTTTVAGFRFRVWSSTGGGWGTWATQTIVSTATRYVGAWGALGGGQPRSRGLGRGITPAMFGSKANRSVSESALLVAVVSGGTTAIGQASETDTAQAFGRLQTAAIGQPSETDTAQAFTVRRTFAVGQATETDFAQAFAASQARAIGQASETDVSQAMTSGAAIALAQASETDTAQAFASPQARAIAQATEADTAQAFTVGRAFAVGQAVETDTAQALVVQLRTTIGQVSEADSAGAMTLQTAGAMGQAAETDSAQPLTARITAALGQALETDTAQALTVRRTLTTGIATETDVAQPMTARRTLATGQASETDLAQSLALSLPGSIAQASETDVAQAMQARQTRAIGQPSEADTAQPMTRGAVGVALGQASETDAAQAFVVRLLAGIAQAIETDAAQALAVGTGRLIGQAQETDAALAMAQRQLAAIGIAVEFDSALSMSYPGQNDEASPDLRFDIPGASLRFDVVGASLRIDIPSMVSLAI